MVRSKTQVELFQDYCKNNKKWGLYLGIGFKSMSPSAEAIEETEEILKAAPYLKDFMTIVWDYGGFIVCDTEEEMKTLFNQTVGPNGPTSINPYDGPASVYALTISNGGTLLNENT